MDALLLDILCEYTSVFKLTSLLLTCHTMYKRAPQYNLTRMLMSHKPEMCTATTLLRKMCPVDSWIPYTDVNRVCVLGITGTGNNDVCTIGSVADVVSYIIGLMSVGIGFQSLQVWGGKAFVTRRRRQYINKGYGQLISLRTVNVVDLR